MPTFSWIAQSDALSNAALTVRAQTISPNDLGRLVWDIFMPRKNVPSIRLDEIGQLDFRPASDRREWNGQGRLIPLRTPNTAKWEMTPIEAFFNIDEYEMQRLMERTLGNEALFREMIGADVPDRIDSLAAANYRRLELETLRAWALGTITARNPVDASTSVVSLGFDAARYEVAMTAWNDGGQNAYNNLMAWLARAIDLVGPIQGVQLRQASFLAIKDDAPNPWSNQANVPVTRAQLEARIQDELGSPFSFYINENSVDEFTDGGTATSRVKTWPAEVLAAIPAGEQVGYTAFAPVVRAYEMSRATPQAKIDTNGQTAYLHTSNEGRHLNGAVQVNALPIPTEAKIATVDIGV